MANFRRHFNFNSKASGSQESYILPSCKPFCNDFDKHAFMNDICKCLDLCCTYVQALNTLCGAGCSLARSLFNTVRDVSAYHNISLQFLSVWEEVSKATAGASAAVKTETLMLLQEILNGLEMASDTTNMNDTISESFQAIGTCLCSFIELQAQFSWNTWKSLSKLSKSFSSESFKHSLNLQRKSYDKSPSKVSTNSGLNSAIKKHYSQLKAGLPKFNETVKTSHFQPSSTSNKTDSLVCSDFSNAKSSCDNTCETWSTPTSIWTTTAVHFHEGLQSSNKEIRNSPDQTDLDEVINLLSCVPIGQFSTKCRNDNFIPYPPKEKYDIFSDESVSPLNERFGNDQAWYNYEQSGNDAWFWRLNSLSSDIGMNTEKKSNPFECTDFHHQWEDKEIQKWDTSTTETGSSSDDVSSHCLEVDSLQHSYANKSNFHSLKRGYGRESMPGGLENVSTEKEQLLTKINTWPLKQSLD